LKLIEGGKGKKKKKEKKKKKKKRKNKQLICDALVIFWDLNKVHCWTAGLQDLKLCFID
jgi:hypothetical protein